MKVKIGKYKNWIGPRQIADKVFFWVDRYPELLGEEKCAAYEKRWDYRAKEWFSEFLSHGFQKKDPNNKYLDDNRKDSWLSRLCSWIYSKRKRTIKVKIDEWDTWSMDHTLAYIITPMLKQLQETKHGAPFVDDEDVPEELKSTSAPPKENEYDTDANHFKRWDWVLDEMIHTFQCCVDEYWEDQFYSGEHDISWEKTEDGKYYQAKKGPNDTFTIDREGMEKAWDRRKNGLRLFAKYYHNLWD